MKTAIVVLFLASAVSAHSSFSYDCDVAKMKADRNVCLAKNSRADTKAHCLNGLYGDIITSCTIPKNKLLEAKKEPLRQIIRDNFTGLTVNEKANISSLNASVERLNDINEDFRNRYVGIATEISDFSAEVRDEFQPTFSTFKSRLDEIINQAQVATTSAQLSAIKFDMNQLTYNEIRSVKNRQVNIQLFKQKLTFLQDRYLENTAQLRAELATDDLVFQAVFLEDIEQYLQNRYSTTKAKIQQLETAVDQKTAALLNQETKVVVDQSRIDAVFLRRSSQFLSDVTETIAAFRSTSQSSYLRIPFQAQKWDDADALLNLVAFCESSSIEYWQSLGCHNAIGQKSMAARVMASTIPSGIRFGINGIRRLDDQTPQVDMLAYIESLLEQGRVQEAAYFFDDVLRAAEAVQ